MSSAETRRRARRGLLVLLDGLVIAALAAVITARSNGTGLTDLAGATVGILSTWVATPGVGTMEAIAYAGFAVAVLGPLWFWGVRSVVGPVRVASRLPSRDAIEPQFEFTEDASTVDRQDERGHISDGGDVFRTVLADELQSSGPDWTEKVFGESAGPTTMAVPEGDFLRGGGNSGSESSDRRRRSLRATFGPPEDGDTRRSVDIHALPDESEADQETGETVLEASHEATEGEQGESRSEETELDEDVLEAIGAEQSETDEPPSEPDAEEPEQTTREPADPLERLGEQISESQARISAVEERLTEATAPNGVDTAQAALADRTAEEDILTNQLEVALAGRNFEIGEAIEELRADQGSLESAFEAVSHGS